MPVCLHAILHKILFIAVSFVTTDFCCTFSLVILNSYLMILFVAFDSACLHCVYELLFVSECTVTLVFDHFTTDIL